MEIRNNKQCIKVEKYSISGKKYNLNEYYDLKETNYKITIFTPTYNRSLYLERIYNSIIKQKNLDNIEWLIVDDGSIDETKQIVEKFSLEKKVKISYYYKKNGGKHTAYNLGLINAEGEYFFCLDSDDYLHENAIEKIIENINEIKLNDCGIIALKSSISGKLLSNNMSGISKLHLRLYSILNINGRGEYTLIFKTSVARQFLFPVFESEKFMSESVVYDRIDISGFLFYVLPEIIEICEYQENGLTSNIYKNMIMNPGGYMLYHFQRIKLEKNIIKKIKHIIQFQAFKIIRKANDYHNYDKNIIVNNLCWLPGKFLSWYYLSKFRNV